MEVPFHSYIKHQCLLRYGRRTSIKLQEKGDFCYWTEHAQFCQVGNDHGASQRLRIPAELYPKTKQHRTNGWLQVGQGI